MQDSEITKDEDYYPVDVIFLVEGCLFKVPRAPFEQNSDVFRDMFQLPVPGEKVPDGSSDEQPLRLEGVKKKDFRLLLKVLVPRFSEPAQTTSSEWFSVLKLSLMWQMDKVTRLAVDKIILFCRTKDDWIYALKLSTRLLVAKIRDTAIEKLQDRRSFFNLVSIDKVLLGKECHVANWVLDGYKEMVEQTEWITLEDEGRLGVHSTLGLYRVRDRYRTRTVTNRGTSSFNVDLNIRFNFASELQKAEYTHGSYVTVRPPADEETLGKSKSRRLKM